MRLIYKLLLLSGLAACGAPGSDEVFTKGAGNAKGPDSATVPPVAPAPRLVTTTYSGYFRRVGSDFQFQPCNTKEPLAIYASAQGRSALRERTRWNAVWEGTKRFGVFQGAIVTDTPKVVPGDSTKPGPRTRFYLTAVDSLRTWQSTDCGGMRVS